MSTQQDAAESGQRPDIFTEDFLRSIDGKEVPRGVGRHLFGPRYPNAEDLKVYLDSSDDEATRLPHSCPIVSSADYRKKEVLYGRTITLSPARRNGHVGIIAPTGCGKSTRALQPMLLSDLYQANRSIVAFSLKGEEIPLMAAVAREMKKRFVLFDVGENSTARFNPLASGGDSRIYDVIAGFVELVVNHDSHDSEFWRNTGEMLMVGAWQAGCRSFADIQDFYEGPRPVIISRLQSCTHRTAQAAASFLSGGGTNSDTSLATTLGWLNAFRDPAVRRATGEHDLGGAEIFERPVVIAVRCPEARLASLRAVYNLIFQYFSDLAIEAADRAPFDDSRPSISFFVEDLPAFGAIPSLIDRMATFRSRRISVTAAVQSRDQLEFAYGHAAKALEKAFATKILLGGIDPEDAEYYARGSGVETFVLSYGRGKGKTILTRNVLDAADLRNPGHGHFLLGQPATFLLPDATFQAYLCPIYLRRDPAILNWQKWQRSLSSAKRQVPKQELKNRIEHARRQCGFDQASAEVKARWLEFEHECEEEDAFNEALEQLDQLIARKASLKIWFRAIDLSRSTDLTATYHILDYLLRLKHLQKADKPNR